MNRIIKDTGTLDAAAEVSAEITSRKVDIHVLDAGSFSGTIQVQQYLNAATWVVVDSFTQADLPYHQVFEPATLAKMRLYCSARAAGATTYYLEAD
jgi:hypothetical protein